MQIKEHHGGVPEPEDFRRKQQVFYEKYGRTYEQISSQTLHSSFHPKTYSSKGTDSSKVTYIVKLDQLFYPASTKLIELDTSSKRGEGDNSANSFGSNSKNQRKNNVFSINQNIIEEEENEEEIKQVHFSQPKNGGNKYADGVKSVIFQNSHQAYDSQRKLEMNTQYLSYEDEKWDDQSNDRQKSGSEFQKADAAAEKAKALKMHLLEKKQDAARSTQNDRKMLPSHLSSHRKTKMITKNFQKNQRDNSIIGKSTGNTDKVYNAQQDDDKSFIFNDPQPLQQRKVEMNGSEKNFFELSIWSCEDGLKADNCLAFQRFSLSKKYQLFKDSFIYSVDGNHLFLLTLDITDYRIAEALVFSTSDLKPCSPNEVINLRKADAFLQQLNSEPQLIPGTNSTSMMIFIETAQELKLIDTNGEIVLSTSQNIENNVLSQRAGQIRNIVFRRISSQSSIPQINVLMLIENLNASSKYRFKAYQLMLEDFIEFRSQENSNFPFFKQKAVNKANIKFKSKKDLNLCYIKSFWQSEQSLLMISIQPNSDQNFDDLVQEKYEPSNLILASLKDKNIQFNAQLSTDYYKSQNLQFCKEPLLIVFNEKLNSHVGLTVEIIMTLFKKKNFMQNQLIEYLDLSHIDSHQIIKIKAEEKLAINCLDVLFIPSKREYTLLSYDFVDDKRMLFLENVKGKKHFLKTYESLYINPYFVTMENQCLLSIYSIHSQSKVILQYKLPNQTSFLKFVEMYRGSITLSDSMARRKDLYRHQALFFLTKTSEWGSFEEIGGGLAKLSLECIEMPKYDGLNDKMDTEELLIDQQQMFDLSVTSFQIHKLRNEINLDINLRENRNIVRCIIGNVNIKAKIKGTPHSIQNYLVIQSSKQLIVQQLGKDAQVKYFPFGNNFETPMCISRLSETESEKRETLNLIYLQATDQTYELNMLRISSNNLVEQNSLCKLPPSHYAQIQSYPDQVLLFDSEVPEVSRFIYQARTKTFKKMEAFQFVDELKQLLETYQKSYKEITSVLTSEGIYIGPCFFQYLEIDSQDYEEIEDFEVQRAKEVGNIKKESLLSGGPILSQDCSRLFYHVTSLESQSSKGQDNNQFQIRRQVSEISASVTVNFTFASKLVRTDTLNAKNQSPQIAPQRTFAGANQIAPEPSQANLIVENAENYKTRAFEIPLFEKKEFHILPQDEYLSQSLIFSTYVIEDLILIYLNQSFLLFNQLGRSISLIIDPKVKQLLLANGKNLKLVQIKMINKGSQTAILMEDEKKYYGMFLENKGFKVQINFQDEDCIDKKMGENIVFQNARFDIFGKLYHIIIQESKAKNYEVQIYERKNFKSNLSVALSQYLNNGPPQQSGESSHKHSNHEDIEHKSHSHDKHHKHDKVLSNDSYQKLLEHSHSENDGHDHSSQQFIFEILHDQYIVLKQGKTIYFIDMRKTQNLQVQTVDVILDGEIISLHQTQSTYLLQFVYRVCQKVDQMTLIFTWDLNINAEYSVQKVKNNRKMNKIYKSIDEQLNFYIPNDKEIVFDNRYEFPVNYFSGSLANSSQLSHKHDHDIQNCQEIKICSLHQTLMGICREKLSTVQLSFSVINLQYMEYLSERLLVVNNAVDYESPPAAILQYLQFAFEANNPLHFFGLDHTFLEQYSLMVKNKVDMGFSRLGLNMVSYALMQNSQYTTPFAISIDSKTLKSIELILNILCQNTNSGYDYFRYMKKYFIQLIETKSSIFFKFFDQSFTEKDNLRLTSSMYDFTLKPINIPNNTRFMNQKFFLQKLGAKEETKLNQRKNTIMGINASKSVSSSQPMRSDEDPFKDPTHIEEKRNIQDEVQPVQVQVFDFGWLLKGRAGVEFIDYLAHQDADSPIFKLKNIKTIVNAQWKPFRKQYLIWTFFPYCVYFACILVFNTLMNAHIFSLSRLMQYEQDPDQYTYDKVREPCGIIMCLFALYFLALEFLKMKAVEYRTKNDYSIYLMVIFHLINMVTYLLNLVESKQNAAEEFGSKVDPYIIFSAASVMCSYFVFLIHLQIFGPFAFYINLIIICIRDSFVYNIILSIGGMAFTNCMFILAMLEKPDTSYDKITGVNIFTGILNQVKGYLYDPTAVIKNPINKYVYGFIYILYTLIISQIMLKVLINLFHHFYENCMETYDQERLRLQCILIRENEFYFGREKLFERVKYIFRFYAEQLSSITEKSGGHGKHGGHDGGHESSEGSHHGGSHAPPLHNSHHGNNHKKRAGHHGGSTDNHEDSHGHTEGASKQHEHGDTSGKHDHHKKDEHKKGGDGGASPGIEAILTQIQARLDSIDATIGNKK